MNKSFDQNKEAMEDDLMQKLTVKDVEKAKMCECQDKPQDFLLFYVE